MKPNAGSTIHVVMDGVPTLTGIEQANLSASRDRWRRAKEKAAGAGVAVGPEPAAFRELESEAARLEKETEDILGATTASRMRNMTVDGDLSEWAGVKPIQMRIEVLGNTWRERDYPFADFYLGWDEDNIYVAARVKDATLANNYRGKQIWNGDAIEVFIDTTPDKDPTMTAYTADAWQFVLSPTNADGKPDAAVSGNPTLMPGYEPKGNRVAAGKTEDGWAIECAVNRAEMGGWRPTAGARIGFTVGLDDSDGGDRVRQFLWRGRPDTWNNRTRFGRLLLAE